MEILDKTMIIIRCQPAVREEGATRRAPGVRRRWFEALHRAFFFGALLTAVSAGRAGPIYSVSILGGGPQATGATTQLVTLNGAGYSLAAIAGPSGLGASSQSSVAGYIEADSSEAFNDFVISGPGSGFVDASLNVYLSGSIGIDVVGDTPNVGAGVVVSGLLNGTAFSGLVNPCVGSCGGQPPFYTSGILSSVTEDSLADTTIDGVFNTGIVALPVNQPFSVSLELQAGDNAGTAGTSAFSLFFDTLSFSTTGPVFDLPPGYTVNSVDAGIVNNQFSTAPEPGALILFATGLVGILVKRFVCFRRSF